MPPHPTPTLRPPATRPAPRPASYPLLSTRQGASAFNQPLSFDTSSVTDMQGMFEVRSSPCPALLPICSRALSCAMLAPPTPATLPPPPHLAPHQMQGESAFNQSLGNVALPSGLQKLILGTMSTRA